MKSKNAHGLVFIFNKHYFIVLAFFSSEVRLRTVKTASYYSTVLKLYNVGSGG